MGNGQLSQCRVGRLSKFDCKEAAMAETREEIFGSANSWELEGIRGAALCLCYHKDGGKRRLGRR